jgi:signal transduction histidine kinase
MPDFPDPAAGAERQDVRRHGRSPTRGKRRQSSTRALHLGISVIPAAVVGLLGIVAVAALYAGDPGTQKTRLLLIIVAVAAVVTLGAAVYAADSATRRVHLQHVQPAVPDHRDVQRRLGELGFLIARGRQDLQELAERLRAGETAAPRNEDHPATPITDPFMQLAYELRRAQSEAWNAVIEAANHKPAEATDRRVDVFVNLARRMQSLSHRAIQGLDELENQVEDPDLLKGLFRVDHLSTRMRRQAESLAVIGGAASRRQWSRPVTTYEVLRSAIAEVEHYNRVKVVPPVDGTLHGSAVADVIHLLAELIENATKFAPPHTQVLVRIESVTAGLAIEVEDRGLGIPREDQRRLNDLLARHERVDTDELLQDGRIGLLVVSALANRHNVRVQLQTNLYGGTQAIVVVPKELVGTEAELAEGRSQAQPAQPSTPAHPQPASAHSQPASALAVTAPAPASAPPSPSAPPHGSGQGVGAGPNPMRIDRDAADTRLAAQASSAAWEAQRPAVSAQQSGPQAGGPGFGTGSAWSEQPVSGTGSAWSEQPVSGTGSAGPGQGATGERPPLPRRRAQANLAPELINVPAPQEDDQEIRPNPGLMAAFKTGMRSGQEDGGAADGADSTN